VIWQASGALLCVSQLETTAFNLTPSTRLTIMPGASGVFELS
jgi:hypothetical protein